MNILRIKKAATDFRDAIEKCSSSLGISFEQFPLGSCGDTVPREHFEKVGQFNYSRSYKAEQFKHARL